MKRSISFFLLLCVAGCGGNANKIPLPFKDSKWELRTGTHDKKAIQVRLNQTLINFVGSLNYEATVSIAIKQPLADGMPNENESAALKKIGDMLVGKLDQTGLAVFAMEIQSDKKCDFIFYTNKKGAVNTAFSEMGSRIDDYQVDYKIIRDQKWTNYKYFYSFVISKGWN